MAGTGFGLVAFFRWSVDVEKLTKAFEHSWNGGWPVSADATARIAEQHAAWAEPGGPAIIVKQGTFKFAVSDGSTVGATIGRAAMGWRSGSVLRYVDAEQTARAAVLGRAGETTLQIIDGRSEGWEHRIDELRRGMTALGNAPAHRRLPPRAVNVRRSSEITTRRVAALGLTFD